MRSKHADLVAHLAGDQLDTVLLIEFPAWKGAAALYFAIDTQPHTWNSKTFAATSGFVGQLQESAEREVPTLQIVLQNADGVIGPLAYTATDGVDFRGRRVIVREAARSLLTGANPESRVIEWVFFVNASAWLSRAAIAFDVGVFPAEQIRVPWRNCQGLRCRWVQNYKGRHCGYAGDLATCEGTVEDCARHFPDEPLRFGGFPTSADARVLRVF